MRTLTLSRGRDPCETEPHVRGIPFGVSHSWNDCQEEDFVDFLKIDSSFCCTADVISKLLYIKIKSFYAY